MLPTLEGVRRRVNARSADGAIARSASIAERGPDPGWRNARGLRPRHGSEGVEETGTFCTRNSPPAQGELPTSEEGTNDAICDLDDGSDAGNDDCLGRAGKQTQHADAQGDFRGLAAPLRWRIDLRLESAGQCAMARGERRPDRAGKPWYPLHHNRICGFRTVAGDPAGPQDHRWCGCTRCPEPTHTYRSKRGRRSREVQPMAHLYDPGHRRHNHVSLRRGKTEWRFESPPIASRAHHAPFRRGGCGAVPEYPPAPAEPETHLQRQEPGRM